MSTAERDMISELLSDTQMRLMVLGAEQDLVKLKQETASIIPTDSKPISLQDEDREMALALSRNGMAAEDIAERLKKPLPLIKRWLKGE